MNKFVNKKDRVISHLRSCQYFWNAYGEERGNKILSGEEYPPGSPNIQLESLAANEELRNNPNKNDSERKYIIHVLFHISGINTIY